MTNAQPYSDQKNWSDTYLTDPKLIKLLGPFDLDPCCPEEMPWRTATRMLTTKDDALSQHWGYKRTFMNPPYRGVMKWARKFTEETAGGIALLNGRSTETKATQLIMSYSKVIWFPKGRLSFFQINGKPYKQKWFPSLLIGLHREDEASMIKAQQVYGGEMYYK